tara:strand:+ start:23 stop:334 length:312 start_codon:yes stop_codon:yes gene_type:complete
MKMNKGAAMLMQRDLHRWLDPRSFFKESAINLMEFLHAGITKNTHTKNPHYIPKGLQNSLIQDIGSRGRTRTSDQSVNSRPLYQLSYSGTMPNGSGILREGLI